MSNSLSLLIYLTSIVEPFRMAISIAIAGMAIITILRLILTLGTNTKPDERTTDKQLFIGIVALIVVATIIPSRETMMLITRYEIGRIYPDTDLEKLTVQQWLDKERSR